MRICAVIAEFNPFHNGHRYILNVAKKSFDATVVIMSPDFVQRGSAAVADKYARAKAAILGGADVVIELPVIYALSSAPYFARGAVETLDAMGVIDTLLFGSECGDINALSGVCDVLEEESEGFKMLLAGYRKDGFSYPAARQKALSAFTPLASLLEKPNNILAIEYLRALRGKSIRPHTLLRNEEFESATSLRAKMEDDGLSRLEPLFLYALRTASKEDISAIFDCDEALTARIIAARGECSIRAVIDSVKCKSYTESRIRRVLCNLLIKNTIAPTAAPEYIRVLALGERGGEVLSATKGRATLPIITKTGQLRDNKIFAAECRASDVYNISRALPAGEDFTRFLG